MLLLFAAFAQADERACFQGEDVDVYPAGALVGGQVTVTECVSSPCCSTGCGFHLLTATWEGPGEATTTRLFETACSSVTSTRIEGDRLVVRQAHGGRYDEDGQWSEHAWTIDPVTHELHDVGLVASGSRWQDAQEVRRGLLATGDFFEARLAARAQGTTPNGGWADEGLAMQAEHLAAVHAEAVALHRNGLDRDAADLAIALLGDPPVLTDPERRPDKVYDVEIPYAIDGRHFVVERSDDTWAALADLRGILELAGETRSAIAIGSAIGTELGASGVVSPQPAEVAEARCRDALATSDNLELAIGACLAAGRRAQSDTGWVEAATKAR